MTRIENSYPFLYPWSRRHTDNFIRLNHHQIAQLSDTGRYCCIKNGLSFTCRLNSPIPGLVCLPDLSRSGFQDIGRLSEMKAGLLQAFLKRPAHQRHHSLLALRV